MSIPTMARSSRWMSGWLKPTPMDCHEASSCAPGGGGRTNWESVPRHAGGGGEADISLAAFFPSHYNGVDKGENMVQGDSSSTPAPGVTPPAGKMCPKCGRVNPEWRSECENCKAPLRGQAPAVETQKSFGGSLGTGCLSFIGANIITNGVMVIAMVIGLVKDSTAVTVIGFILAACIAAAFIARASRKGKLNPYGIATAAVIWLIIQIFVAPLLLASLQ